MRLLSFVFVIAFFSFSTFAQRPIISSSDIQQEINRLGFLGNVLYLAAHPDDENTRLIAWLENEKLARTAYLSLTRGDGGQNLIGTEKGAAMGILRTQELLEARKVDGGEQFFTRAVDFGYSKTPEETFEIWGKDKILSDVVWIIRKFRPDVIITRFPTDGYGGHGHHTASALLAEEAFKLAADKNVFPEQLQYVNVWQPTRILCNVSSWWDKDLPKKAKDNEKYIQINIGEYNSLIGASYTEIAAESRSQHKSQGFGASKTRGTEIEYLKHVDGQMAKGDLFSGIETSWKKYAKGEKIIAQLQSIQSNFQHKHPEKSVPALVNVYTMLEGLEKTAEVQQKQKELKQIIKACLGIYTEAISKEPIAYTADRLQGTFTIIKRADFPVKFSTNINDSMSSKNIDLKFNQNLDIPFVTDTLSNISQPYWLHKEYFGIFEVEKQELIGRPENPAFYTVPYTLTIEDVSIPFEEALQYKWTDRVDGENYRDVTVEPIASIHISDPVYIFSTTKSQNISVVLDINKESFKGNLKAIVPNSWKVEPQEIPVESNGNSSQQVFEFKLSPPTTASSAKIQFKVVYNGDTSSYSKQVIDYPHIKRQLYFPKAAAKLVKLDIKRSYQNIGYIMGSGDEVPQALEQIGYNVEIINPSALGTTDLHKFDAILVGIRAYNTEKELIDGNAFLMEYVKQGGNLIAQYATNRDVLLDNIGPYPFTISRDRVTKENAEVHFIDPKGRLLNNPNVLQQEDFSNWVQERGLYFADEWDENYRPVFSWQDPGESEKKGALIVADYGKGHFMYTGISFFRQLPAGVPGAFRLLVNMIEY